MTAPLTRTERRAANRMLRCAACSPATDGQLDDGDTHRTAEHDAAVDRG